MCSNRNVTDSAPKTICNQKQAENDMHDERPSAELASGRAYPGKAVHETGLEYVVEFTHATDGSCYMKLNDLDEVSQAIMCRDLALGQHRRWAVQRSDGDVIENLAVGKIMTLVPGGYEMLVAEMTKVTLQ